MAIVATGDTLVAPILQSGWTVVADGFGLNTSVSVFKGDTTTEVDAFLVKGTAHPDTVYSYLKLDKWRISWDALNVCTITVDYVGIDPAINEGARTNPNTFSANGLTSEPLTSHPAFFNNPSGSGYAGDIAGPAPYSQSSTGPLVPSKTSSPPGQPSRSFMGVNGACFESENGGRFIGFVDPTYPSLYGKTNYLATTTSYSGVMYFTEQADVLSILDYLNTATATTAWDTFDLLPDWAPVGTASGVGHKNLLSQINVQEFGSLYKVNYEIRYSPNGWDAFVYRNIP
jgi:hypothetical protein